MTWFVSDIDHSFKKVVLSALLQLTLYLNLKQRKASLEKEEKEFQRNNLYFQNSLTCIASCHGSLQLANGPPYPMQ